jgi:hypothetical protein
VATPNGVPTINFASRDLSPAHRINNARRVSVLREMLEQASDEQKTQVRSAFLSLSVWLNFYFNSELHFLMHFFLLGMHSENYYCRAMMLCCFIFLKIH